MVGHAGRGGRIAVGVTLGAGVVAAVGPPPAHAALSFSERVQNTGKESLSVTVGRLMPSRTSTSPLACTARPVR